jgi:hypothetical protein
LKEALAAANKSTYTLFNEAIKIANMSLAKMLSQFPAHILAVSLLQG